MNTGQSCAPDGFATRRQAVNQQSHDVVATGEEPFGAFPVFLIGVLK